MRTARALLFVVASTALPSLAIAPTAWAQRRPRAPRAQQSAGCGEAARNVLGGVSGAIGACVVATRGFQRGEVHVTVTLGSHGQVLTVDAHAQVNGADNGAAVQCVDRAVRAARYPGCPSTPMLTVSRNWSFQPTPRS